MTIKSLHAGQLHAEIHGLRAEFFNEQSNVSHRNAETHGVCLGELTSSHSYDLTCVIQHRPTGICWIDRGVRLQEVSALSSN